jgi:hypothetical protein
MHDVPEGRCGASASGSVLGGGGSRRRVRIAASAAAATTAACELSPGELSPAPDGTPHRRRSPPPAVGAASLARSPPSAAASPRRPPSATTNTRWGGGTRSRRRDHHHHRPPTASSPSPPLPVRAVAGPPPPPRSPAAAPRLLPRPRPRPRPRQRPRPARSLGRGRCQPVTTGGGRTPMTAARHWSQRPSQRSGCYRCCADPSSRRTGSCQHRPQPLSRRRLRLRVSRRCDVCVRAPLPPPRQRERCVRARMPTLVVCAAHPTSPSVVRRMPWLSETQAGVPPGEVAMVKDASCPELMVLPDTPPGVGNDEEKAAGGLATSSDRRFFRADSLDWPAAVLLLLLLPEGGRPPDVLPADDAVPTDICRPACGDPTLSWPCSASADFFAASLLTAGLPTATAPGPAPAPTAGGPTS